MNHFNLKGISVQTQLYSFMIMIHSRNTNQICNQNNHKQSILMVNHSLEADLHDIEYKIRLKPFSYIIVNVATTSILYVYPCLFFI